MPPATTSKSTRPASIYSEGLTSSMKKRASISPSPSSGRGSTGHSTAVYGPSGSSSSGMASGSGSGSSSMLNSASRSSFKREREVNGASTSSNGVSGLPSSASSVGYAYASTSTGSSNTIPIINTTSYTSSSSTAYHHHHSQQTQTQSHASYHSHPHGGPLQLPPISDSGSFGLSSASIASSPMKVDTLSVVPSQPQLNGKAVMVGGPSGVGASSNVSGVQGGVAGKVGVVTSGGVVGSGSVVTKENRLLFEDDYAGEVVEYMQEMEILTGASADLMDMQPELQWYMRPFLVDFLVEIHQQFRLRPEVLYLSLNIVDRYVSKRVVYKKHYQLVGCAALWIASKFEDAKDRVPTVRELADMCCKAYDETAFIQMEGHVLQTIGWTIGHPTAEAWLRLACMGNVREETRTQHVARFVMEITLFHREFVGCKPSSVAAASLMLARFICGLPRKPSSGDSEEIMRIIQCLDVCFHDHLAEISQIVLDKYAPVYYSRASAVVKDWYASGKRYVYLVMPAPISPASSSGMITPGLVPSWSTRGGNGGRFGSSPSGPFSASSSEAGDEMPRTPITPVGYNVVSDPFLVAANAAGVVTSAHVQSFRDFKENIAPVHAGYPGVASHVMVAEKKQVGGPVGAGVPHPGAGQTQAPRIALNPVQVNANVGTAPVFPRTLRRLSN